MKDIKEKALQVARDFYTRKPECRSINYLAKDIEKALQSARDTALDLACGCVFGNAGSDNASQRIVNAILALKGK